MHRSEDIMHYWYQDTTAVMIASYASSATVRKDSTDVMIS